MRMVFSSRKTTMIESFRIHADDVVELKLSQKGFSAKPGQVGFFIIAV